MSDETLKAAALDFDAAMERLPLPRANFERPLNSDDWRHCQAAVNQLMAAARAYAKTVKDTG